MFHPAGEIGRSSHDLALKALGLRPNLTVGESQPTREISLGKQEPSASALPQNVSEVAPEEEEGTEIPDGPGVPQPETYLGSLVPESELPTDKRKSQKPAFLVPGQGKLQDGNTDAIDRINGAAAFMVSGLFEGPYGISHDALGPLVNQSREDAYTPVLGLIRTFNEVLIEGGTQLGDLALRTAAAPFVGGIAAVGQAAIELGMTPTEARRLVRDLYIFGEVSAIVAGTSPTTLARRGRLNQARKKRDPETLIREADSSGVLDRHIKQLTPEQRDAAKRRLQQSYDEGQRAARKEIELRDLSGAEQAANPPSIIRQKLRDLVDFVQRNRSDRISRDKPERVWFGRVSDSRANELRKQLKEDYGIDYDLRGAVHRIDEDSVGHILGGHNDDYLPFTKNDFELIPEIVETGNIIPSGKLTKGRNLPAITYRKLIGDWYYVVEEVQKKGRILSAHTAYKSPAPKHNK